MWPDGHSLYNMLDFFDHMFFMSQALGWVLGEKKRRSDMGLTPPPPRPHTYPPPSQGLVGIYEFILSCAEGTSRQRVVRTTR